MVAMILQFLIVFNFWFSYSQRLPIVDTVPVFDYEWKAGYEANDLFIEWLREREGGIDATGREHKYVKSIKEFRYKGTEIGEIRVGGHDFSRSAKNIDYQEVNTVFSSAIKDLRAEVGIAYLWKEFKSPDPCLKVGICYNNLLKIEGSQVSNFDDKCFMNLYIGKRIIFPVKIPGLYFGWENYVKYLWEQDALKFYQAKTELRIEFDFGKIWKKFDDVPKEKKSDKEDWREEIFR